MDPIRIAIAGAGRMGQAVQQAVDAAADTVLAGVWHRGESLDELLAGADVLIDFSLPEANAAVLQAVRAQAVPLVCGVSGLAKEQLGAMRDAAKSVPIVFDRNMSQGIAVLDRLVRQAAGSLDGRFSVDIHEVHHVHKIDAPSGTALQLGETVADARNIGDVEDAVRFEVERRGEIPGEHTIRFTSPTETLVLHHSVTSRAVFADGAIRAGRWVVGRDAGLYRMQDVLFPDE